MADRRWKATERAVAGLLGGTRVPVTGRGRGSAPDIEHPSFSLEVKDRASLPAWLHDAMAQAKASCKPWQIPCVVLHEGGMAHAQDYCVFLLKDVVSMVEGT